MAEESDIPEDPEIPDGFETLANDPDLEEEAVSPDGGLTAFEDDITPEEMFGTQPADANDDDMLFAPPDMQLPPKDLKPRFPNDVFPASSSSSGTWQELAINNGTLSEYIDGRKNSSASGTFVPLTLATGQKILLRMDNGIGQSDSYVLIGGSAQSSGAMFPVKVRAAGTSGGNPTYDVFDEYTGVQLSTTPLLPEDSNGDWQIVATRTAAPDNTRASAYYANGGLLHLHALNEKICTTSSTVTVGDT